MVTVIFAAAGQGKRMKAGVNKVFLELCGRPVLLWTLLKFSQCAEIDRLVVAVAPDEVEAVSGLLCGAEGLKPYEVVAGGAERQYSVANALNAVPEETEIVLVHDAARPLVSLKTVEEVIAAARQYGAAIAAVPEKNTVKVVNEDKIVVRTPERSLIWEVQTPQGFNCGVLKAAYRQAERDGFLGTDDASLVERLGKPVKVVQSEYENIKITTPGDMTIAEAFLHASGLEEAKESVSSFLSGAAEKLLGKQAGSGKRKTKA